MNGHEIVLQPEIDQQHDGVEGSRERSPSLVIPLEVHGRIRALIRLWSHRDSTELDGWFFVLPGKKGVGSVGDDGPRPGTP